MTKRFAVLAIAAALATTPAAAQQTPTPGYKDPGTSTLVSLAVPGGGHLYSGETSKGLMLLGGGLGGLILGTAMTGSSIEYSCDFDSCEDGTNWAPMAVGYLAFFGTWIYGIMDADDSAHRMNARRGLTRVMDGDVSPLVSSSGTGTRVGISLRF